MIRIALPKGRNFDTAVDALRAAGARLTGLCADSRRLVLPFAEDGVEILLLKDWDLPRYVEQGVADCGIVGSDVLEEVDGELLVPLRLDAGRSRLSLIGRPGGLPAAGQQVRLATKFPRLAGRLLAETAWSAEVVELRGSLELAPLLDLVDLALDIVQTGRTLREHGLVELQVVRSVQACLVVNRASFQRRRNDLNAWCERLEGAGVAA
jgi:ATP phosphoribosyltransferase